MLQPASAFARVHLVFPFLILARLEQIKIKKPSQNALQLCVCLSSSLVSPTSSDCQPFASRLGADYCQLSPVRVEECKVVSAPGAAAMESSICYAAAAEAGWLGTRGRVHMQGRSCRKRPPWEKIRGTQRRDGASDRTASALVGNLRKTIIWNKLQLSFFLFFCFLILNSPQPNAAGEEVLFKLLQLILAASTTKKICLPWWKKKVILFIGKLELKRTNVPATITWGLNLCI